MGKVVGIDLGTTNSVVAVMEGGKPVVIANAEGMRTTPSVVAFSKEEEMLVGQMARRQSVLNPQNTFFGVKRYIGRRFSELSAESKRVPYTIRKDDDGGVRIKCPRLEKEFAPEEVAAMVLRKLADEASRYLGQTVTGAVITVPAYFNDSQRQATRDAGRIAGLDVLRIINEPTAASLAYGLDRRDNQIILVFDLGGGTFDVSILEVGDGVFEVKATAGDTQLGGNDFDKKIVDWLAEQFLEAEGIDLRRNRQSLQRLTEAAEKAKIELSGVSVTDINLPFITATADGPKHLETRLTRSQFEGMCTDLLSRLRGPVRQALRDTGFMPDEIDEVVLVGGGSRMPMVKQLVRAFIDREPSENVNPDEAVAIGAAIQAGILTQEVGMRDILLLDVTPLSVGLETIGGVMKKLIPRNTTIPVRRSDVFSTSENNQTMVEVHVVQGEREMASDNKSLGRFKLMGIPPAPRGVPQVQVSFDIDANGILQVTAVDRTTGREQGITIQGASTLSEGEIQRMILDADRNAQADRERREKVEKRTRAEAMTYQAERQLREVALDFGMQFASGYRRRIENLIQELRDALKKDDERGIDVAESDLRDALYELQREVYEINREEEEEEGFFGSIKRTLFGDEDDDFLAYENPRDRWDERDPWNSGQARRDSWDRPAARDSWDQPPRRDSYGRDSYKQGDGYGRDGRDSYGRDGYRQDSYGRDSYTADPYDNRRPAARQESWNEPVADSWDAPARRDIPPRDAAVRNDAPPRDIPPRDIPPRDEYDRRDVRPSPPALGRSPQRDSWDDAPPPRRRDSWDDTADSRGSRDRPARGTDPMRDDVPPRPANDPYRTPPRSDSRRRSTADDPNRYGRVRGEWDDDDDDWL